MSDLQSTAKALVAKGKGILAADESNKTAEKRLLGVGVESTEETRRQYRGLFLTTPGIEKYLSGVILFDETFRQQTDDGVPFVQHLQRIGVIPGIKVDGGTVPLPGSENEVITQGLDGLPERLKEYAQGGCKFTKWRAAIRIGKEIPSHRCITENAEVMSLFAVLSQGAGLVPICEPEVLLDGTHDIALCFGIVAAVLVATKNKLKYWDVDLSSILLKTSMVLPGKESGHSAPPEEVARATLRVLDQFVPREIPGIVFLSGGQAPDEAVDNLRAIAKEAKKTKYPWELSFSFARALQQTPLEIWHGKKENVTAAQKEFLKRLKLTANARDGK